MKIAENIKCKDFVYRSRPHGGRLSGQENLWVCDVYYNGHLVTTCDNKTVARRWVSQKVKAVNAVLDAARKKYGVD